MIFLLRRNNSEYKLLQFKRSLQKSSKIILGIDPGTLIMGFAIIRIQGSNITLTEMSVLKMKAKDDNFERLQQIHEKITALITEYRPDSFAIEAPFFGKNVQSMLKLGRAQGVAIAAAMQGGLTVAEYAPRKIKQVITGNGNADKEQVWKMLRTLLSLKDPEVGYYDASDALAAAVCHHFQEKSPFAKAQGKKVKGWEAFVKAKPERVRK